MDTHLILAFYHFVEIEDPHLEVKKHLDFLKGRDIRCRNYISHAGINAQMSATKEEAQNYMDWLKSDPRFSSVYIKIDPYHEHVFPRANVKFRKQLVALDAEPDLANGGEHLSPRQWKEKLEERDENTLLLDVRNDYEWKIGHFEGAELPTLETFRQFPEYVRRLKEERDPKKTKVMMYCTGGIRCELFSALMKEEGFEQVYQLNGGVIGYGHEEGSSHWQGRLFVFDDRLTVPISKGDEDNIISRCMCCDTPSDAYYNCANMDCNELFILCPPCAEKMMGCCSEDCMQSERLRPYDKAGRPKPFKKWYNYTN